MAVSAMPAAMASNNRTSYVFSLGDMSLIRVAVLKDCSPSYGRDFIADGRFTGRRIAGLGVTAAALLAAGVRVFSEHHLEDAAADLMLLERQAIPDDWPI